MLPEPLRPKQPHHLHAWPSQGQTQALQGSLRSKPQWTTHIEVETKPQLKPRGSVAKEEDSNPSHQLYSCQLNPHNQLSRFCAYGIYKRSLRVPTKENTLTLIAVDTGGERTHRSRTRLESELPPQQVQRSAQCWRAS